MRRVRAAVWGTGRVGAELVKAGLERDWLDLVVGIVFDPAKEGRDLGEVCGTSHLGVPCTTDVESVLARPDVDLVFYTGIGSSAEIASYCTRVLSAGKDCVTLSGLIHVPTAIGTEAAAAMDATARAAGTRFVGTGIGLGFVADVLPAVLLTAAVRFDRVIARRGSSMNTWGPGVLKAYGVGMPPEHVTPPSSRVSNRESLAVIGEALGLRFDEITERNDPLIAKRRREGLGRVIEPGTVTGFQRRFAGLVGGRERVVIEWNGAFLHDREQDGFDVDCGIEVEGGPLDWMKLRLDAGMWDDPYPATAARGLGVVQGLLTLPPGVYHGAQIPVAPLS